MTCTAFISSDSGAPSGDAYADRRHREWMRHATVAGAITPAMLAYVQRTYGVEGDVVVVGFDPDEQSASCHATTTTVCVSRTPDRYIPGDQRPDMLFDALDRVVRTDDGATPPIEMIFAGTGRDDELQSRSRGVSSRGARVSIRRARTARGSAAAPT